MSDPTPPAPDLTGSTPAPSAATPAGPAGPTNPAGPQPGSPAPRRRRRRWPWVLLTLFLLLVLLVVLGPTLAGLGPVRSLVVSKVNQQLAGSVDIDRYSVGWLSGVNAGGIKVYDPQKRLVLEVDDFHSDITLLNAARGNLDLGNTEVTVNLTLVKVDENGRLNLLDVLPKTDDAKSRPKPQPTASAEPAKLPDVKGKITVHLRGGTIELPDLPAPVFLQPGTIVVDVPDINQAARFSADLAYRVGDGPVAKAAVSGTADAIENNQVAIDQLAADVNAKLADVNLQIVEAILRPTLGKDFTLGGTLGGDVATKVAGVTNVNAKGQFVVTQPSVGGGPLGADTVSTASITVPIDVAVDQAKDSIAINRLGVELPEGSLIVTGNVTQKALQNLAANKAPGSEGQLTITNNWPGLEVFARQLKSKLAAGVQINDADFSQKLVVTIKPDSLSVDNDLSLSAAGSKDGKPITLEPLRLVAKGQALPQPGKPLPDLRDLLLTVNTQSNSVSINAGGATIAQLAADGAVNLDRIQQNVAQFVDLGGMKLAGVVRFGLKNDGDPTAADATIVPSGWFKLERLVVTGLPNLPPIQQPDTRGQFAATVQLAAVDDKDQTPRLVRDLTVAFRSLTERGDSVIDLAAKVPQLNPRTLDAVFVVDRFAVPNLALAQQQAEPFVPAIRQMGLRTSGELVAGAAGRFDGATRTLVLEKPATLSARGISFAMRSAEGYDQQLLSGDTLNASATGIVTLPQPGSAAGPTAKNLATTFDFTDARGQKLADGKANVAAADLGAMKFDGVAVEAGLGNVAELQNRAAAAVPSLKSLPARVTDGQVYVTLAGAYDGAAKRFAFSKPLELSTPNLSVASVDANGRLVPLLNKEKFTVRVNGVAAAPAGGVEVNLTDLAVNSSSNLVSIQLAGGKPFVLKVGEKFDGGGAIELNADAARLAQLAQAFGGTVVVDGQPGQVRSGFVNATLAVNTQPTPAIDLRGKVDRLTVTTSGAPLRDQSLTFALTAKSPGPVEKLTELQLAGEARSDLLTATLSIARLVLARADGSTPGVFDMVPSADVALNVPSLPRAYAVAQAFIPPAKPEPAKPGEAPAEPLPPLQVLDGSLELTANVRRDPAKNVATVTVDQARLPKLALARGEAVTSPGGQKPVSLRLVATVLTKPANDPKATLMDQLDQVRVDELSADAGFATVSMPRKILVTNLTATIPSADGQIAATGDVAELTNALAVLTGGEPMPYAGQAKLTQDFTTRGTTLTAKGTVTVADFAALDSTDRTKVLHREKEVLVTNDVSVETGKMDVVIQSVSVKMPQSQAVAIDLTGAIRDALKTRQFENVVLKLAYDLEKLTPIVRPLLGPDYANMQLLGSYVGEKAKTITVNGPFPAVDAAGKAIPFNEGIKSLTAGGVLSVDKIILPDQGAEVWNLDVPFILRRGTAVIAYPDKPKDVVPAADFNSGKLALGGFYVDLTTPVPRVYGPKNHRLLTQVSINKLLGDTLGKYINPTFANSKRAEGRLDVTVQYMDAVAADPVVVRSKDSGKARVVFSLSDMDIANPVGSLMLGPAVGAFGGNVNNQADTFRGEIKDGWIELANGRTTQQITLSLKEDVEVPDPATGKTIKVGRNMPLTFEGDIRLSDLSQQLAVNIPAPLLAKFVPANIVRPKDVEQILPNGLPLTMRGTTLAPKMDFGNMIGRITEGVIRSRLNLGGDGGGVPGLGDLLNPGGKNRDREDRRDRDERRNDRRNNNEDPPPGTVGRPRQ